MTSPHPLTYDMYYHIFSRGVNRENIFIEKRNYEHFLRLYAKYIEPVVDTFAYCLLKNHFHLLVKTKTESEIETFRVLKTLKVLTPSQQFSKFLNAYAKAINNAYNRTGSLFQHPFGRVAITQNSHLFRAVTYIHQNPQRHGLIDDFRAWPYSSYHALTKPGKTLLRRVDVLAWFDGEVGLEEAHEMDIKENFAREFAPDDD